MIRLSSIAVICLVVFFPLFWALSAVSNENEIAAGAAVVLAFLGLPILLLKIWRGPDEGKLYPESAFSVTATPEQLQVQSPEGEIGTLSMSDLQEIIVETNDTGPWGADVWWHLIGPNSRLSYPQGATGESAALEILQKLPGFDDQQLIQAMGSTSNKIFICWRSPNNSIDR